MKQTLTILAIIIGTIVLTLLTSWLLSWPWVASHWVRQAIIIIFMATQLLFGVMMTVNFIKQQLKPKK